jgi:hypothetical protein
VTVAIRQHVGMLEGPWDSEVAPTHRVTRRDRRAWRRSLDGFFVDVAIRGGVLEVGDEGGGRLNWWRVRRRLRRRYGIVASRVGESSWELHVQRP